MATLALDKGTPHLAEIKSFRKEWREGLLMVIKIDKMLSKAFL